MACPRISAPGRRRCWKCSMGRSLLRPNDDSITIVKRLLFAKNLPPPGNLLSLIPNHPGQIISMRQPGRRAESFRFSFVTIPTTLRHNHLARFAHLKNGGCLNAAFSAQLRLAAAEFGTHVTSFRKELPSLPESEFRPGCGRANRRTSRRVAESRARPRPVERACQFVFASR